VLGDEEKSKTQRQHREAATNMELQEREVAINKITVANVQFHWIAGDRGPIV
jgi:hypothetical protein